MSVPRRPSPEETQLAQARKAKLEAALARKRLINLAGFLILLCGAIVTAIFGPELVAFSIAGVSLIVLLQALSAHSHLQVVRQRKAIYLFPDFSVLHPPHASEINVASPK